MPQLVKKRRSGWAVLATGALVASILAVGAGPVSGQQPISRDATPNNNPDWGADWSACVGAAGSHDNNFPDVSEGNVHADDIDCIAYYGVTLGMNDGTYAPDANVTAFEMELFVQRAADLMDADGEKVLSGVTLSDHVTRLEMAQLMFGLVNDIDDGVRYHPTNNDIEFRDTAGKWHVVDDYFADARAQVPTAESQLIGAAYELGITRGTRGDGTRISTADSTFEPFANVTRAQMASFIARTLDHSNLRPEGLAVQRNLKGDTLISLRDGDFMPIENEPIDVFSALYPDEAFDPDDGECELLFVKDETPSHDVCQIDIGDQLTDDEGNVEFELVTDRDPITVPCTSAATGTYTFTTAQGSGDTTFWAWTGRQGDEFNEDTVAAELEDVARPVGRAGPDYARVSGGLPTGDELAKMGETVTFTVQLYSETGVRDGARLVDDKAVGPDRTNNVYLLQIERYHLTRVASAAGTDGTFGTADDVMTDSDWGDAADLDLDTPRTKTGSASSGAGGLFADLPGDWNFGRVSAAGGASALSSPELIAQAHQNARIGAAYYTPRTPNVDGKFDIVLTNPDLYAAVNNTDVGVRFTLRPFRPGNDLLDANPLTDIVESESTHVVEHDATLKTRYGTDVVTGVVIFSDDPSDPHSAAGASESYRIISGSRTPNTVTVKVVDQYGDPLSNVDVTVNSNLDVIDRAATTPADGVLYPEQVDITVQASENADRDANAGENTLTNPRTRFVSLLNANDIADGSGTTVRTTRTVALRVQNDNETTAAQIAEDDVIGTFKTRRNGTYRIGYAYTASTEAQTETITPQSAQVVEVAITKTTTGSGTTDDPFVHTLAENTAAVAFDATTGRITAGSGSRVVTPAELGSPVLVYWTDIGTSGQSDDTEANLGGDPEFVPVYVTDVGRRTIVANEQRLNGSGDTDNPMAYIYDEDDVFIIENIGASFEMFEEALGLRDNPDGCHVETVSWENYTFYRDPDRYGARPGRVDRTIWEITLS